MTNLGLIGAVAVSLLVVTPAMAMQRGSHHRYVSSARHARKFGYRSAYGAYGFYTGGDVAPGNVDNDFDRRNTFN